MVSRRFRARDDSASFCHDPARCNGQQSKNASIDPDHIFFTKPVLSPVTEIVEPVEGSEFPLHIIYVETVDGLDAPIGLRKPPGDVPFPIVLFAHMNGG